MISEIWDYWTTKTQPSARKFGYLHQSIALQYRAQRCQSWWRPHLLQCQAEVERATTRALEEFPDLSDVVILGSGPLLEIPLATLEKAFRHIYCVDLVHPKAVQRLARGKPKLRLIEADLNGLSDSLAKLQPGDTAESMSLNDLLDEPARPALWISANLWSQLQRVPCHFLQKKGWSEEQLVPLASQLQRRHWQALKEVSGLRLLYSDYRLEMVNSRDRITQVEETVAPELLPEFDRKWLWDLAPIPEFSQNESLRLRMFSHLF